MHAGYLLVLAFLFGGALVAEQPQVIGHAYSDMYQQFLSWRAWGFAQMAMGHLPLWNPHIYAGAPFIGGFQSALFYPPNAIFLLMPLHMAINVSVLLHLMLLACSMFHWALAQGLRCVPAALAGLIAMLGGACFLQVYAGHLSNLCAMAWIPLILRAVETVVARAHETATERDLRWILVGSMSVAMQILAGHPQYVYYTAMAVILYLVMHLTALLRTPRVMGSLLLIPALAVALAAVQLLPSWQAIAETIRALPLPQEFASKFALPPENLLTTFLPNLFGETSGQHYFGRGYLWDGSVFVGATVLFLAGFALMPARRCTAPSAPWQYPVMVVLLTVLALGIHTPVYPWLLDYMPGFSRFRGTSKFSALCIMYLAMLAAFGLDRLMSQPNLRKWIPSTIAVLGLLLLLLATHTDSATVQPVLQWISDSRESYVLAPLLWRDVTPVEVQRIALFSASAIKIALVLGAASLLLLAMALQLASGQPRRTWIVGALAALELLMFAKSSVAHFPVQDRSVQALAAFVQARPGDYRSAYRGQLPNHSMLYGGYDLDGSDPGVTLRYAQWMHAMQGHSPDEAQQLLGFDAWHPVYDMLRLRYVLRIDMQGQVQATELGHPMPVASLVGEIHVIEGRDAMFAAIAAPEFDPRKTVLLERAPGISPSPRAQGKVTLTRYEADEMNLDVELDRPAILLVTDLYTPSWRVQSLRGSTQVDYELLPANYVLRAVPLQAGRHHLRIFYDRRWLYAGMAISVVGVLCWVLLWMCQRRRTSLQVA